MGRFEQVKGHQLRLHAIAIVVIALVTAWRVSAASASASLVLTPVPGSPVSTGSVSARPDAIAFSPSGSLLAVANLDGTLALFSVSPAGALTPVPGSPFTVGNGPASVAFSPSGSLLAINDTGAQTVWVFSVGPGGALTQVPGSPFPGTGTTFAFSPSGAFLASGYGDSAVQVYSVASSGALTAISGSPFPISVAPTSFQTIAFSPSGALLATGNDNGPQSISVASVAADGSVSEVPGSPFSTGTPQGYSDYPWSVAWSPSGTQLAVGSTGGYISMYSVSPTGAVTSVPGSPLHPGNDAEGLAFSPSGTMLAASGGFLPPLVFAVSSTGALTQLTDPNAEGAASNEVAWNPAGTLLAATDEQGGTVTLFSLSTTSPTPTPAVVAPAATAAPVLSGVTKPGHALTCTTGTWSGHPTGYSYAWYRNGTLLTGLNGSTYTVGTLDEGTTLTCKVTATNTAGSTPATSNAVKIPVPKVARCPAATGSMTGTTIGQIKLGMLRSQALYLYRRHSNHGKRYEDFFCLTPIGVRVGYASPDLRDIAPRGQRGRLANRVVWASTSNPYYSLNGVRPGEAIATAAKALGTEPPFHIGLNYWYLARKPGYTAVLKVRGTVVEELGIADNALTTTRTAQDQLMHSFY